jgi:hypothetical protein
MEDSFNKMVMKFIEKWKMKSFMQKFLFVSYLKFSKLLADASYFCFDLSLTFLFISFFIIGMSTFSIFICKISSKIYFFLDAHTFILNNFYIFS